MKKILTTLTLLITLCSYAFGQYDYHFDQPGVWEGAGMRIGYGEVYIDGSIQKNVDYIEIAAFINNEVHGRQLGISDALKSFTIGGANKFDNSEITFKVFNHLTNEELTAEETAIYLDEQVLGPGPWDPYKIYFTTSQPVAKIGNTEYNTLAAAVEAATEGNNEITLLRNAEGKGIVIDKNITIDFNTYTYTFVEEGVGDTPTKSNGFQILAGNTVTLKNGALNVDEESKDDFYILIQNYSNLTVENMKLDGTNLDMWSATDGDSYVLSNNSGNVSISNSTIKANNDGTKSFAFDVCKYASYTAPVVTLDATSTISGIVELSGGELYTNAALPIVAKKSFEKVSGEVGETEGWGTISTPIANVNIPANENHDLYMYEEKTAMWRYYTNENGENAGQPFSTFELGQGYLYANKEDITIELTGTLNVEPVELNITYTPEMGDLAGFNFVGNPFAHNISEAHFVTTNGARLSNGFYVVSPDGAIAVRPANAVIAPMESVMVQTDAKTKLTINNVVSPASKRSEINNGQLEINVANANYSDVAYVSFNDGKGLNKIGHRNAEIPMVYVPVDGVNYAIAMMNQDVTEIPVSFQAATMGEYTIGVEAQDCEYAMMTLVDRFTGIETNLLLEDYTFIAKSNDSAERFIIKLAMDNSNGDVNENFAFINNGMMYIYNIEGQGVVNIYDVTGRPVAEYNVAESANISTSEFAAGVYIIRMSDENGVKVQKIVVE
ncbi:MAG: T9SS type A sorting domain-containing protein [Lentimicrobiaceae bacterium]|nr:T9SS type A sorting domain-containing protein [Lentimicrobiaceae bacterium]